MECVYGNLADRARFIRHQLCQALQDAQSVRILIALAGPPGSGKSTIAKEVARHLNQNSTTGPQALVLPMDGFHLSRSQLQTMPNADEAFARRGIYWTYNAERVVQLVRAMHESRNDPLRVHKAPYFDHVQKDPIEDALEIGGQIQYIILEGNWLLLDKEPWSNIHTMVDDTWFVDVDPTLALERVAKRHIVSGIENSWEAAIDRARNNDLVNGSICREMLIAPAVRIQSVEEVLKL